MFIMLTRYAVDQPGEAESQVEDSYQEVRQHGQQQARSCEDTAVSSERQQAPVHNHVPLKLAYKHER